MTVEERRARLAHRHLLSTPAEDPVAAAVSLVGLHSSDPATVYLSAWARVAGFQTDHMEEALYGRRELVRILGMRRTMFVVPRRLAAAVHHSCALPLAPAEWRRAARMIEDSRIAEEGGRWIADVAAKTLHALEERGEAVATELAEAVPELSEKIVVRKRDGSIRGSTGVSTRILFLLATEGKVVRARPRGTWVSSQYRWAPTEEWLDGPLPHLTRAEAQGQVLSAYLGRFGPASEADIKWWTGWPVTQVRNRLADLGAVEIELEGATGYVLPSDVETTPSPAHWVALLPSLDATVMGWKERSWYLGELETPLFDRYGNAGATVWVDGRVVGGWAQRSDGSVVWRLLVDVGKEVEGEIGARAESLERWILPTRVTARFRSRLDLELSNS